MNKQQTKYYSIKQTIQNMINSGELPVGSEIPSETELITLFEVSRVTARRAIDELARDGYIEKVQGKRAYVKESTKKLGFTMIQSYTQEIIRQNMTPSRKVLECVVRKALPQEAESLKISEDDYVFSLIRIYYADGDPLCYTHSILPYDYFNDIENHNYLNCSLYDIIENEYLVKIKSSTLSLKAVGAFLNIANLLHIPVNTPVLYSKAVTYGIIGDIERPIESFTTYYLTDKLEYSFTQTR